MVSVCMLSYNHEKFISQALESILMQKVNFKYEIVVGEDCSTDNTRNILLEYSGNHPGLFKLILQKTNTGGIKNFIDTLNACSGKYVAYLETDDYWTDEFKLQKQIDFLESNPEYGMVHTRAVVVNQNDDIIYISGENQPSGDVFDFLIFQSSFIMNCTTFYRRILIKKLLKKINKDNINYVIDYYIWVYIALFWKIKFLNDLTSAHRARPESITRQGIGFHSETVPYIITDIINERFLISKNKKIKFMQRLKYGIVYSRAVLSRGMKIKDKIKRSSFFIKRYYLIPAIFISFILKLYSYINRKQLTAKNKTKKYLNKNL